MTNRIDFAAAEERLQSVTADPTLHTSLMRIRKADKSVSHALAAFRDAGLSLDYVLFGQGKPFLPKSTSSQPTRDNN